MEIRFTNTGDSLCFYLSGELDEHYAKGVKQYIDDVLGKTASVKKVVFNLNDLDFMDSTGVGMLLGRYKRLKKIGAKCFIESPKPSVEKVIEVSGIYDIMPKV